MTFSDADFNALIEAAADFSDYRSGRYFAKGKSPKTSGNGRALRLRDPSVLPPWALDLRRMLSALAEIDFGSKQRPPLPALCEAGARLGWQEFEGTVAPSLLALVSKKARRRLKGDLQRILERVTRPCLELEQTSYNLALAAIGLPEKATNPKSIERRFLGEKPSHRLFVLFEKFPVLPRLWSQLISQWRDQVTELLVRLAADQAALSRAFLGNQSADPIIDLRCSLSDPHNGGRTVMLVQFPAGSVIYKPRPGDGEWDWSSFLQEMNARSFHPKLRAARVVRRKGYCWMEWIDVAPCKNRPAARRFHERIGALIAVAYLLRAVDCHRDNLIASGEDPVLVDAETLWHVSSAPKPQTPVNHLTRTGFFSNSNPRSLQSRSSVLGRAIAGKNVARIGTKSFTAAPYQREIAKGFGNAWRCILGTPDRYEAFAKRVRRIRSRERRRIYWPTEKYAAIKRASIQPAALRSGIERHELLARSCRAGTVDPDVIELEVEALRRLDIPYFLKGSNERSEPDKGNMPADVCESLRLLLAECFG